KADYHPKMKGEELKVENRRHVEADEIRKLDLQGLSPVFTGGRRSLRLGSWAWDM
ncbi:hypothetical protein HAX54_043007, partial [Datura stramonium]|nr:hypothetical protein [Datura stramonium]